MKKNLNEVMESNTSAKASEGTLVETFAKFKCDWGEEDLNLYYDEETGYFLAVNNRDFFIIDCPAKPDKSLVERAVNCWLTNYEKHKFMWFSYDSIEEDIMNAENSVKYKRIIDMKQKEKLNEKGYQWLLWMKCVVDVLEKYDYTLMAVRKDISTMLTVKNMDTGNFYIFEIGQSYYCCYGMNNEYKYSRIHYRTDDIAIKFIEEVFQEISEQK